MPRLFITSLLLCAILTPPLQARSEENNSFLSFSLGTYNILDTPKELDARLEYRPDKGIFIKELKPWAGLALTSKFSFWAGAGLLLDLKLGKSIYLTPSFGMGYYARGKSDTDLHYPLAFRSQLELAWQLQNRSRFALAFSHTSNASLGRHNPGVESIALYYHLPLYTVF